jgi:hypothetical protein
MNLRSQDYLAKLLAKENLEVQHGNYKTASFNVIDRVLRLPLWADKGKAVSDLLVGHEVGHALYTPAQGWHESDKIIPGVPRSYINIVEDIRIEKKIQETYPGIVRSFKKGYKILFDDNLFGTEGKDITKYNIIDRLNISAKSRGYVDVTFSEEEQPLVDQAMAVETWEDVLESCKALNEYVRAIEEDKNEEEEELGGEGEGDEAGEENESQGESMSSDDSGDEGSDTESSTGESESNIESETDEAFRSNEESLLEQDEDGIQPLYSNGINPGDIKRMITPYATLLAEQNNSGGFYENPEAKELYSKLSKTIKPVVNSMAKEFERKKAAFEYSRARDAKSGSLNVNKLHQYKYSEDIFKTVTTLAQAKSHGIVMFMDLSGSMHGILEDVIRQTITIAQFCARVHIPFEIYTFTTGSNGVDRSEYRLGDSALSGVVRAKIVEVANSKLNKKQLDVALKNLMTIGINIYKMGFYQGRRCNFDSMGSTPLVQTMIASADIITAFQKKNGVQKTNVIVLTDGFADSLNINEDECATTDTGASWEAKYMIKFKNTMIKGDNTAEVLSNLIGAVGKYTNSNMIGFFLAENHNDFFTGMRYSRNRDKKFIAGRDEKIRKEFLKNGIVSVKRGAGYDEFFIIKVATKRELHNRTEAFAPKKTEAIKDIKREFRKFSKSKKHTRQLVNKITDAVAA